jgi:3-hydroxyisobutyrate dehydrogenase
MEHPVSPRTRSGDAWLIAGHGSVGSFLAARLAGHGLEVAVLDPHPRLPVVAGEHLAELPDHAFAHAVSCVPPAAAEDVARRLAPALRSGGLLFDWNTVAPEVKKRISDSVAVATVDVALLDSLDGDSESPSLAVSGPEAGRGVAVLEPLGFTVSWAGGEVGDAAALKYLRSIFMKSLEALTLEFASLASELDNGGIVQRSIERNLGERFGAFMELLIATNRVHAERRGGELEDAVATFARVGLRPELAEAAVSVLHKAAEAWRGDDAPPQDAQVSVLTDHLRRALWVEPASM